MPKEIKRKRARSERERERESRSFLKKGEKSEKVGANKE